MITAYSGVANEMVRRIRALIPDNPEILDMTDPSGLLQIEGFGCDDLAPSYFQASWSLNKAKTEYRAIAVANSK